MSFQNRVTLKRKKCSLRREYFFPLILAPLLEAILVWELFFPLILSFKRSLYFGSVTREDFAMFPGGAEVNPVLAIPSECNSFHSD